MLSYNVVTAAQQALRARADWMEQGQSLLLAVRLTPTTVDSVTGQSAQRCPDCWDDTLRQTTVPDDPTCRGVGWVIPAQGATGQQGGYLNAVPLPDAFVNDGQDTTTWTPQGVVAYTQDVLYYSPSGLTPKKGDVVIRSGSTLAHSRRYVVGDSDQPKTLGGAILFMTAVLEYRHPDDTPIYTIGPADTTGLAPGTWS